MASELLYQKGNNECATPNWLKESLFKGWYDPCPLSIAGIFQVDGLSQPWQDRTYVNPPYSEPLKWVKKAIEENKKGKTVALLLKLDCSTEWFRKIMDAGAHLLFINERLHFNEGEAAPFCSAIFILYSISSLSESSTGEKYE